MLSPVSQVNLLTLLQLSNNLLAGIILVNVQAHLDLLPDKSTLLIEADILLRTVQDNLVTSPQTTNVFQLLDDEEPELQGPISLVDDNILNMTNQTIQMDKLALDKTKYEVVNLSCVETGKLTYIVPAAATLFCLVSSMTMVKYS